METSYSEIPMSGTPALGAQNSAAKPGKGSVLSNGKNLRSRGRRALLDVTNDSPIAGLALDRGDSMGTPASNAKRCPPAESVKTPGTGEALLRYQVKSLLKGVGNEHSKPSSSLRTLCHLNGYRPSPSSVLAPTPANTPDSTIVPNHFATDNDSSLSKKSDKTVDLYVDLGMSSPGSKSKVVSSVKFSETLHPEVIDAEDLAEDISPEKPISRALLFDSPEKDIDASISSPISVISSEDSEKMRSMEDDDVSEWSVQVNISSPGREQSVDYSQEENEDHYSETENRETAEEDDEGEYGEVIRDEECEELCAELNKVSVHDIAVNLEGIPAFEGKHTRFVYNSDDELEGEEVVLEVPSPSVVCLKGLPTPKGKHLRFQELEDSENASANVSN